jgi:hypothetical protein
LASLLRKTTETGDIGLFSIGSARSLDAFHKPVRPNLAQPKSASAKPPPIKAPEEPDLTDDRKTLPSYRDSTVGITPLYESAHMASGTRSFSSPSHIGYPRLPCSYSMATCSSGLTWVNRSGGTTPDSRSSDIRHPTLVDWESQSHGRKEYGTPKFGRRTLSLSSTVGVDERACDGSDLKRPYQVSLPGARCFSYSEDTNNTFSNLPAAPGCSSPLRTVNFGTRQAEVSD